MCPKIPSTSLMPAATTTVTQRAEREVKKNIPRVSAVAQTLCTNNHKNAISPVSAKPNVKTRH
jgi:hypothetical protein